MLPTFEKESILTDKRLAEFAQNTNPLITQLRPAARELSPTLMIADRARAGPQRLPARRRAARRRRQEGPAGARELHSTRCARCLPRSSPFARSLNPTLQEIGLHDRDVVSFIANAGMATQAVPAASTGPHYLRLDQPVQLGEPGRCTPAGSAPTGPIRTSRQAATTTSPRASSPSRRASAAVGNPALAPLSTLDPSLVAILPSDLYSIITKYAFGGADRADAGAPVRAAGAAAVDRGQERVDAVPPRAAPTRQPTP